MTGASVLSGRYREIRQSIELMEAARQMPALAVSILIVNGEACIIVERAQALHETPIEADENRSEVRKCDEPQPTALRSHDHAKERRRWINGR